MRIDDLVGSVDLPRQVNGPRAPLWWGMVMLIVIESVVFASLVASYFYYRFHLPEWPPAGIESPELLLPTIYSFVLFGSSAVMWWADSGIAQGDRVRLQIGLLVTVGLGLLFLGLKAYEYADVEYQWDTHVYGSIVWTITMFHAAHVTVVILKSMVLAVLTWRGWFDSRQRLPIQINGMYWHFVVALWVPLYVVLYLVPRMG